MPVSCAYLLWQEHLQDTQSSVVDVLGRLGRCFSAVAALKLSLAMQHTDDSFSEFTRTLHTSTKWRWTFTSATDFTGHFRYLTIFPARMWSLNWSCDDTLTVSSRGSMMTQTIYSTRARYVAKSAVGWWYFKWDMLLPCFFKFPCNNKCLLKG